MSVERPAGTFALGTYDGPALALVGELALLRIELGAVVAAKFLAIETGLSFVWRSFESATFTVSRSRPPAAAETCNGDEGIHGYPIGHESGSGNGRDGHSSPARAVRELTGPDDRNNGAAAPA